MSRRILSAFAFGCLVGRLGPYELPGCNPSAVPVPHDKTISVAGLSVSNPIEFDGDDVRIGIVSAMDYARILAAVKPDRVVRVSNWGPVFPGVQRKNLAKIGISYKYFEVLPCPDSIRTTNLKWRVLWHVTTQPQSR